MNAPIAEADRTEVVVIGSGAAGLLYAIELARRSSGTDTIRLVTKGSIDESNTRYAQGGIAAVFTLYDAYSHHIQDTMTAGAGLCDVDAVQVLVREAPARIRDLDRLGVHFNRDEEDRYRFTREGGHEQHRILYVGDMTGKAIESALVQSIYDNPAVRVDIDSFAIDLIVSEGRCHGVWVLDRSRTLRPILAKVVVLATGGAGQLFSRTTNPAVATGDGVAMADRAGVGPRHIEFVQFHPTAFHRTGAPSFLLSETIRGEGGILRTLAGEPFMKRHHPMADLAPRDIVSRAIYAELTSTGTDHVLLDISHKPADFIRTRFPSLSQRCLEHGIDLAREPVPVSPAAHYMCGGVPTDIDGCTSLQGLYAIGETACTGVHGANRLASNSLLESVVFAYRAAVHSDWYVRSLGRSFDSAQRSLLSDGLAPPCGDAALPEAVGGELAALRVAIGDCLWRGAGVVRSDEGLARAAAEVTAIARRVEEIYAHHCPSPALCEVRNLARVAELVVAAARHRRQNVGSHFSTSLEPGRGEASSARLRFLDELCG
ncbi:MAG: L-aspartate oxidase [Candidatus Schekmanbacteria bacterium]|nr:L-aspartate oxidase [Candidatus Schekmanbacteria bacterium]